VQWADPRLIRSHHTINEVIQIAQFRKRLGIHKIHMIHYQYASREPEYFRNNPDHTQKQSNNKETTPTKKERLFITNTNKGHKVIDLTRPNKRSTTTSKETTKSTGRTWLWKRPRAPSYNTAEDNQLGYTVVFKGRTQCIQDGYQQHSGTTWTRQGSQASVYPSPM
jgi:hypothetical protein